MVGGLAWNSFVFMEFEDCGGVSELTLFLLPALDLDFAELIRHFLELARQAGAVQGRGWRGRGQAPVIAARVVVPGAGSA